MTGMWSRALAVSLLTAGAVGGVSGAAWATPSPPTPIAIVNPSFEITTPSSGVSGSNGTQSYWFDGSFDQWSQSGYNAGWFHPSSVAYPGGGSLNSPATGLPNGVNVAWLQGRSELAQTLSTTLTAGTQYTLSFYVGQRADGVPFSSYSIELLVGGVAAAITSTPVTPGAGGFLSSSVSFTSVPFDPRVGQNLGIALISSGATNQQVNIDNLSLVEIQGAFVPEPDGLALFGSGLGCLLLLAYRPKRGQ